MYTIALKIPDPLWYSPCQPRNQTKKQDRSVSMRTCLLWIIHGITIQLPVQYNTLPVIGKQHNWSWGNYPWQPWPGEKLGHGCYNSPDTLLVTVRKGQTESSVHQANRPDRRPHETSRLSNTSRIIGVPLQLASESQMLQTFLGSSCRNGHSQQMSYTSVRGLMQRINNTKPLTSRLTTLRYLQLYL